MPAITNVTELQAMNLNLAGNYWLANDIDASATVGWNAGAGFVPIGRTAPYFTGTLDGKGHTISDLFINRPATDYVGLFGIIRGGTIQNVILEDVNITADDEVGGLVGYSYDGGQFLDCHVRGQVIGDDYIGGFAGWVGQLSTPDTFIQCTAEVTVTGLTSSSAGGFVGTVGWADFSQCYASGNVVGDSCAGGFVARTWGNGVVATFTDCYARGDVESNGYTGGFTGYDTVAAGGSVTFTNCYSTGAATVGVDFGGFISADNGLVTYNDCFWNTQTSGTAVSVGGTGKTTAQMKTKATFTNWDFIIIWFINGITNDGYPFFFAMPPEPLPDAPRTTVLVQDKITLEAVRNVEMAAGGRFYVDEDGKATYKSRHARNP